MPRFTLTSPPDSQRGVALIVALLVLAIATGLATAMMVRNQNAFNTTAALENGARADTLAHSAIMLAQTLLAQDDSHVDGPADAWAKPIEFTPEPDVQVALQVIDLQGRFNINDLITPQDKVNLLAKTRFQKLLRLLNINTDISNAVIDWIDANQRIEPGGAEDGQYQSGRLSGLPTGLPAGRPMISVSELRQVNGVTDTIYQRLAPYVSALPVGTPLNLNSASPTVLQALGARGLSGSSNVPGRDSSAADASVEKNMTPQKNIGSVADFLSLPEFSGTVIQPDGLSVNSQYFLCVVTVRIGQVIRHQYAVIERQPAAASTGQSPHGSQIIALSNKPCLTGFSCI